MKLTILGKYGPYPKAGGACSGYLLEAGNKKLMLDCGNGTLSRLQQHCAIEELDCIILSHLHSDHMADMLVLRYGLPHLQSKGLMKQPLVVFMPSEPAEVANILINDKSFAVQVVKGGDSVQLDDIKLTFFAVRHTVPCNAVKIEHGGQVFVYSGDLNTTPGFVEFAQGADLLLIDSCLHRADWTENGPHLSAYLAAEAASKAAVKRVILTHIRPIGDEEQLLAEARQAYPKAELAQEGAQHTI